MTVSTNMLDLALEYASRGIPVFPCRPADEGGYNAKSPYIANGFRGASTSERIVRRWWSDHPEAMVGVPTGEASGFWVLDLDKKPNADGEVVLARLEQEHGKLPPTRTVLTPSGGKHLLFKHHPGVNNRGAMEPGTDVRGDGGYVIAAGSVMSDGTFYELANVDADIAEAPTWLTDLVKRPASHTPAPASHTSGEPSTAYVEAAIGAELGNLVQTRAGRNNALNDASFNVGQFVGAGAISRHDAEQRLYAAAVANGYVQKDGERAARQTIKSGLDRGQQSPRVIPEQADDGMAAEGARLARKLLDNALAGRNAWVGGSEPASDESPPSEDTGHPATDHPPAANDNIIRATPFKYKDPSKLPRRDFVYHQHLIRRYVSITVAPGGLGKTSLTIAEALDMVTGRGLFGGDIGRKLRVWVANLEDTRDEMERRIMAACIHYNIKPDDIGGRLFLDVGRERGIVIARDDKRGIVVAKPVVEQVIATILANQIDVLILDPFVSSHSVDENSNGAIDMVAKLWSQIADDTNAAIEIIHHVRKTQDGKEVTVEDGRGAGALLAAARSARALNRMSESQAATAGVGADERFQIFSITRGKANLAPLSGRGEFRKLLSVPLGNGKGLVEPQDFAPVVVPWTWPNKEAIAAQIPPDQMELVKVRVASTECLASDQSKDWAGYTIASALGMDLDVTRGKTPDKERVKKLLSAWLDVGIFVEVEEDDPKHVGRKIKMIRVAD